MSKHNKPPKPLLWNETGIDFHPQVSTRDMKHSVSTTAAMPFYYASFVGVWVYWLTDLDKVKPHFDRGEGDFRPYVFMDDDDNEKALVAINFQTYTDHAGMALGVVNEVEFNICAYPTADERRVPRGLSVDQFLMGIDQTKRIGLFRIHVPADNTIAVAAGKAFFGEPKFFAQFNYTVPAFNNQAQKTWEINVYDENEPNPMNPENDHHLLFSMHVPELDMAPRYANTSPLALYTYVKDESTGEDIPNGSHWQMLLPMAHYHPLPPDVVSELTITAGGSQVEHMADDIRTLIGDQPAVAVQVFRSNPACIEGAAYDVR
ncbi:MAG: hypothetical protein V2I57_09135 [Xanthomonadales bacterium]|jgi:hypothetical protein|nr:hypothetical protein [Xanthomonadales bacterium]